MMMALQRRYLTLIAIVIAVAQLVSAKYIETFTAEKVVLELTQDSVFKAYMVFQLVQ
jgi:hypothetical protein